MGTEGRWELLNLNREGLPRLLVKYVIAEAGYTVSITDLANIWIESLTNLQIIANADQQSCSINPGDDAAQFRIFLQKIRDVLRHEQGTSVRIGLQAPDDLTLALKAPLPFPLPPFEWTMTLSKSTSTELVSEVISPLLLLAHQQQQQLNYLLGQLRKKDHVMSRLLDKMEATNTDLGTVFPGVSGGRNSQRSLKRNQVARHLPEIAPFQPGSELQHSGGIPPIDALYGVLRDVSSDKAWVLAEPSEDAWWQDITKQQGSITVNPAMTADLDDDETDDDLDFQTQTIPDQLQRQRPADISSPVRSSRLMQIAALADDASADDGRVASSPPPVPRNLARLEAETPAPDSPSKRFNTQTRRLGAIGGRSSSQIPLPSSPPKPIANTQGREMSPTPPPVLPSQSQVTPTRRRRLGGIGRGSSQVQPTQLDRWSSQALPALEEESQQIEQPAQNLAASFRLPTGDIAGARETRASKRKASEEREASPRETSVERADRKRQELKQNLNEKIKAPVKRKRRF